MEYRTLGRTGISVSVLALGAGPVSGLMTGSDRIAQRATVRRAIDAGINWFDTAPGYGQGESESNLGQTLAELGATSTIHLATKVRLTADQLTTIDDSIRRSVNESLQRLRVPALTLLQLHNGITAQRGDEPTSITPQDVLGPGGVLESFRRLRDAGLVRWLGLSGLGQPAALREVVGSGTFDAIQVPYHMLNPSAGRSMPPDFGETDYGNIIPDCAAQNMGVLAIRVFAAGALIGNAPSAHTLRTPFFPLPLYERDRRRAGHLQAALGGQVKLKELAVRFVLSNSAIHSAIIGFGAPEHIDEAIRFVEPGVLLRDLLAQMEEALAATPRAASAEQ